MRGVQLRSVVRDIIAKSPPGGLLPMSVVLMQGILKVASLQSASSCVVPDRARVRTRALKIWVD